MKTRIAVLSAILCFGCAPVWAGPTEDGAGKAAQIHYLKASLLEKRGAQAEALLEYEEALAHDPRSAFICREAAELALEMGDTEKALLWALRLQELEPNASGPLVLLGRAHWARGDTRAAEEAFEKSLKLDPASAESIFSLGSILGARSPQKARELMLRFIEKNPQHAAEAHYQVAKLDLAEGKLSDAVKRLKQGLVLEPENMPLRFALAQTYEASGSTDAAVAEYDEILKLDNYNVALIDHLGEISYARGRIDEARAHFEQAVQLEPPDPLANFWLALDWERRGDFGKAAGYVRNSGALKEDPSLNLRLSYYLTQAGQLKEAVDVLEAAMIRWPANDQIAYFLALGYDDLKESERALTVLRKVLALKPDFHDARYQLAVLLEKKGRMDEAEKEFRLLLAEKPDEAPVLNYLGYSLADRGLKLPEAEQLIRQAVSLEPRNGAYHDSLGWALFKQSRSTEAVSELNAALDLMPDDETVWDHLGDALASGGSPAAAWRAWKRSEALTAEGGAGASGRKAVKLQAVFEPGELGGRFMEHFQAVHGGLRRLSGLCRLHGAVLGQSFSYDAMLTFDAGSSELSMDLLGPLFTPLFHVKLNDQGFTMDPMRFSGIKPEALTEAVYGTFSAIRDLLQDKPFALRPALFKKSWRTQTVEAPGWRLGIDASGARLANITGESGIRVALDHYEKVKSKMVPKSFSVSGLGYTVAIELEQLVVELGAPR